VIITITNTRLERFFSTLSIYPSLLNCIWLRTIERSLDDADMTNTHTQARYPAPSPAHLVTTTATFFSTPCICILYRYIKQWPSIATFLIFFFNFRVSSPPLFDVHPHVSNTAPRSPSTPLHPHKPLSPSIFRSDIPLSCLYYLVSYVQRIELHCRCFSYTAS